MILIFHYFPEYLTDDIDPPYYRFTQKTKFCFVIFLEKLFWEEENIDQREGCVSSYQCCFLITQILHKYWDKFYMNKLSLCKYFERNVCLTKSIGESGDKISPQKFKYNGGYTFIGTYEYFIHTGYKYNVTEDQ